jgi:hypothetical protein
MEAICEAVSLPYCEDNLKCVLAGCKDNGVGPFVAGRALSVETPGTPGAHHDAGKMGRVTTPF